MADIKTNYYILLGLSFDPPEHNCVRIKEAIEAKRAEWSKLVNSPMGFEFARLINALPQIEQEMLDPRIRTEHIKQACAIKLSKLREIQEKLDFWGFDDETLKNEYNSNKKYGITEQEIQAIIRRISYLNEQDKSLEIEIIDLKTQTELEALLEKAEKDNLYDFLEQKRISTVDVLLAAAEQKAREARANANKTAQGDINKALAQHAMSIFKNMHTKYRYDNYLLLKRYKELNRDVLSYARRNNNSLTLEKFYSLVAIVCRNNRLELRQAKKAVKLFCKAYGISIMQECAVSVCGECGGVNELSARICSHCGAPLKIICPKCKSDNDNSAAVCSSCGFAFEKVSAISQHIENTEKYIADGKYYEAKQELLKFSHYLPDNPKIIELESCISQYFESRNKFVEQIQASLERLEFYTALSCIENAKQHGIALPAQLVDTVNDNIARVEGSLKEIAKLNRSDMFKALVMLSNTVADCAEANRLLLQFPPNTPTELTAAVVQGCIKLSWQFDSVSPDTVFSLVRKKNIPPINRNDGEVVYIGGDTEFADTQADALQPYYYAVFSVRAGVYSLAPALSKRVVVIPPVSGVKAYPMDGRISLCWQADSRASQIAVLRRSGGDFIRLSNVWPDGCIDTGLANGTGYIYRIFAEYIVNGELFKSDYAEISATPQQPAIAVREIYLNRFDDRYVATWDSSKLNPDNEVVLLYSESIPRHTVGMTIDARQALSTFKRLDLISLVSGQAVFKVPVNSSIFIVPATTFADQMVLGCAVRLIDLNDVSSLCAEAAGDKISVTFEPPKTADKIAVCCRTDRYPLSPDEDGTDTIYVTINEYLKNGAVYISSIEQKTYFITVYTIGIAENGKYTHSQGVNALVFNAPKSDVFYNIKYNKGLLTASYSITATIAVDEPVVLPKILFVKKQLDSPISKTDGEIVAVVDCDTSIAKEVSFKFPVEPLSRDCFIRMYFDDDTMYNRFNLINTNNGKVN